MRLPKPMPGLAGLLLLCSPLGSPCLDLLGPQAWAQAPDAPLRNSDPLPAHRPAIAALTAGDLAWAAAQEAAPEDRTGLRTRAFDAWHEALAASEPGDGVPLTLQDVPGGLFPDPDGTHSRRAEGVPSAVVRRLVSLSPADRGAWIERFRGASEAALRRAGSGASAANGAEEAAAALGRLESEFPGTEAAARAALARFDLAEEAAGAAASAAWLGRVDTHRRLATATGAWPAAASERIRAATEARRRYRLARPARAGFDGTSARIETLDDASLRAQAPAGTTLSPPRLITSHVISGIVRSSDEPFGRGLESGVAFFEDGSALIQGSYGVLLVEPDVGSGPGRRTSALAESLLGIQRPIVRVAPSAGGWPSLPASDGRRAALVVGRAERPRNFMDIAVPPTGNVLAVVARGRAQRPLRPQWVLRDGVIVRTPESTTDRRRGNRPDPAEGIEGLPRVDNGGTSAGWDLGRGWEFQPGPVLADDTVFVLARCLGDSSSEGEDYADQVRLMAIDADDGALLWSRELTSERGLADPQKRGDAGYFASTTMPLALDRTTGTLLVGTNVGLAAAYDVADGRLLWMLRTQRRQPREAGTDSAFDGGWPGTRPPLLVRPDRLERFEGGRPAGVAWFTPFDSEFAYALPIGPAPDDGSLFPEPPRARRGALDLAGVFGGPASGGVGPAPASSLILLGRDGRYEAVLLESPDGRRVAAAYLAPDERFGGRAALDAPRRRGGPNGPSAATGCLIVAGDQELALLDSARDFGLATAARIPSQGVGRGGNVVLHAGRIYVLGRDTVWIFAPR